MERQRRVAGEDRLADRRFDTHLRRTGVGHPVHAAARAELTSKPCAVALKAIHNFQIPFGLLLATLRPAHAPRVRLVGVASPDNKCHAAGPESVRWTFLRALRVAPLLSAYGLLDLPTRRFAADMQLDSVAKPCQTTRFLRDFVNLFRRSLWYNVLSRHGDRSHSR